MIDKIQTLLGFKITSLILKTLFLSVVDKNNIKNVNCA